MNRQAKAVTDPRARRAPTVTADLARLQERLKAAFEESEKRLADLFVLLTEAYKCKLHDAYGHASLTDYLVELLDISERSARHMDLTVRAFAAVGLEADVFVRLGPTRAREIASLISRSRETRGDAARLVARAIEERWTVRQIQDYGREPAVSETGPPEEPGAQASDELRSAQAEVSEQARRSSVRRQSDPTPSSRERRRSADATTSADAEFVVDRAGILASKVRNELDVLTHLLDMLVTEGSTLIGKGGERKQEGERLLSLAAELALAAIVSMGTFLRGVAERDDAGLVRVLARAVESGTETGRADAERVVATLQLLLATDEAITDRMAF